MRSNLTILLKAALIASIAAAPFQAQADSYLYRIPLMGIDALPPPGETGEPLAVGEYSGPVGVDRNDMATIAGPSVSGGATPYYFTLASGSLPPGMSIGAGGAISGQPTTVGTYSPTIRVRDGMNRQELRTVTIQVLNPAGSPLAASFSGASFAFTTGQTAMVPAPSVSGGQAPYSFSGGSAEATVNPSTGAITASYATAGDRTVQVTVRDAQNRIANLSATLSVAAPVTASLSPMTAYATVGQAGTIGTLSISGGRAPYLAQKGVQGLGNILDVQGTTVGYVAPTAAGTYQQPVDVTDADGRAATTGYVTVIAAAAPHPGFAGTYSSANAGQAGTLPAPNPSGGEGPYALTLTANPGNVLSGSPASGLSYGALAAGTYGPFTVAIQDARGRTGTQNFNLVVAAPVQITGYQATYTGEHNVAGTIPAPMITGGVAPYTLSLSPATPVNPDKTVSYNKPQGSYPFTVTATDSGGRTATASFTLNVTAAYALAYTIASPLVVNVNQTITANRTGGTGPFTYAKLSGDYPAGMTLQANGDVTGTPTAAGNGTFTVRVTDSGNSNATREATYAWTVGNIDDSAVWAKVSNITHSGQYASSYGAPFAKAKTCLSDGNYNVFNMPPSPGDCGGASRMPSYSGGGEALMTTVWFSSPTTVRGVLVRIAQTNYDSFNSVMEVRNESGTLIGSTATTATSANSGNKFVSISFGGPVTITRAAFGTPTVGAFHSFAEIEWIQ